MAHKNELFETSLIDINGYSVDRDESFSTQVTRWLEDPYITTLRINIEGIVLRLSRNSPTERYSDAVVVFDTHVEVYNQYNLD